MSILRNCMQQVSEISSIAIKSRPSFFQPNLFLPRCGIMLLVLAGQIGCDYRGRDSAATEPSQNQTNKSSSTQILKRGLPGEPRTLDPQLADDTFSFQVVRDLYEGLTAEDRHGQIVPGVARSWSVDKTGTIYTFLLRSDAQWSDGDSIIATEFVDGLRRAVNPQTASGSASLLAVIKGASAIIAGQKRVADLGVTAIGESSVQIELEHPAPFVLQILSQPIAAPFHSRKARLSSPLHSPSSASVTNGAYTLINRTPGSSIELARNPKYWDVSSVMIERVRYVNAESEATELRGYMAGQLDMTYTIPTPDLKRVMKSNGGEIQTAPILGTLYLALDVSEPPLRDNRDLRQALSMAIDRDQIAEHLTLGVTPAYSFVARGISNYTPPAYQWGGWTRERQLAYARSLFARSGYSQSNPLHLTMYFNTAESLQRIMLAVADNWKENLGVVTHLVNDEFRVFLTGRKDRSRWDVARLGWWADYDDPASFLEIFSMNDPQNDPAYASPDFNTLIYAARLEPDPDKRIHLLQKSEEVMLNDYPIIPIYFYTARRLVKPYLGGAEITPLNRTYSKHLYWKNVL